MNKNLPHALRVIRTALASTGTDPAAAIAHALNDAHLLVDPEKSFGAVLRRTPAGGWSSEQPKELTELEQQALAWDAECKRALQVMADISEQIGHLPAFKRVQADGNRVLVALHITDQSEWAAWRRFFGITHDKERPLPYAVCGEGHRDGVQVSVVAYDVPTARDRAAQAATRPFELDGIIYDLALPQQDADGDVWFFQGQRSDDGMPMLSVDGRPERCALANIVAQVGPLTPVKGEATPVTAQGGER